MYRPNAATSIDDEPLGQRDRLLDMLAEMDARSGPVPDELIDEARRLWMAGPDPRTD